MSRFYSFSLENKEVDYASELKDFLPNKKELLNHYNDLQTELYRLFLLEMYATFLFLEPKEKFCWR